MSENRARAWDSIAMLELAKLYREHTPINVIARKLNRSEGSITRRIYDMGLHSKRVLTWTSEQVTAAKRMHRDGKSMQEIADAINKSYGAVQTKLLRMGLRTKNDEAKTSYALGKAEPVSIKAPDYRVANTMHLIDCMAEFGALTVGELKAKYRAAHELDVPPSYDGHRATRVFFADARSVVGSTMAMCSEVA